MASVDPDGDGVDPGDNFPLVITIKDSSGNIIIPGLTNNRALAADGQAGDSEVLTVEWSLPKDAGNEYQGKSATFGLTVNAEQTANNPTP